MSRRKPLRMRGKLQLSNYFATFSPGDSVAVIREQSVPSSFPKTLQGRTGVVEEKRGAAYVVRINDMNKPKQYILTPIHLRKINQSSKAHDSK